VIEDIKKINGDIRVIAPDLRGHGDTSMPDMATFKNTPKNCFALDLFAADIINLMDQLCIEKFHVVGHSMGSVIAQTLAINYRDRVTSMVLIATFVNGKECSVSHNFLLEGLIENDWKCMLEERLSADWPGDVYMVKPVNMGENVINYLREKWVVEPGAVKDFLESIFPETLKIPLGTWIGAVKALGKIDYSTALRKLNIPILILWGSEDNVTVSRALNRRGAETQRK
jgi:pimeloyl-ACP methyl ester carboxylesterase